ncbi:MAG: CRISPR-associated protein Cas5 [bacterium]
MEILMFDLVGKFAHFRKFYTNNTAMSFTIPPRTTLMGIVGAILGKPRDSYYEELSSDKIRFGIQVKSNLKKSFHRVNYLMIKDERDFRGRRSHVQTPVEVVSGYDLRKDNIRYRIYVSYNGESNNSFQKLKEALLFNKVSYNITLGTANHSASIEKVTLIENKEIAENKIDNEFISIDSACKSENIKEIKFDKEEQDKYNFIEEEMMPADFKANYDREVEKMNRLIYTTGDIPLYAKYSGTLYSFKNKNKTVNIQFLD